MPCTWLDRLCGDKKEVVVCYLCQEEVTTEGWLSGDHRRGCASRQTERISSFPSHPSVTCSHCNRNMKLWPEQDTPFTCDTCNYDGSDGFFVSRYHCFPCDYNLCNECIREMETEKNNTEHNTEDGKKKSNISELSDENIKDENHNKLVVFYM